MLVSILNICTEEELEESNSLDELEQSSPIKAHGQGLPESATQVVTESDDSLEEKRQALRNKVLAIGRNVAHLKNLNEGTLPKGSLMHGREGLEKTISDFEKARKADLVNEKLPPTREELKQMESERQAKIRKNIESSSSSSPVFQRLMRKLSG
ncbi:hypothetical protein CJJ09_004412 [Candidozyma auris]|nr:hypothetical protein CJJ09_004412 [[Candida] auris]